MESKSAKGILNAMSDIRSSPRTIASFVFTGASDELMIRIWEFVKAIIELWSETYPTTDKTEKVHYWSRKVADRVGFDDV